MKNEEYRRLVGEHRQCSQRLDGLVHTGHLTEDEELEVTRLTRLERSLKAQMDLLRGAVRVDSHSADEKYAPVEESINRYAYSEPVTPEEERTLKAHLGKCPSCAEFVSFVRQSRAVAGTHTPPDMSRTGCPSNEQLRRLQDVGKELLRHPLFSKAAAEELREHVLDCRWCRAEYLLISSLANEEIPEDLFDPESREQSGRAEMSEDTGGTTESRTAALVQQLRLCSERLDVLMQKRYLTKDEKPEAVRLKELKLSLKDQMEQLERQFLRDKDKFA